MHYTRGPSGCFGRGQEQAGYARGLGCGEAREAEGAMLNLLGLIATGVHSDRRAESHLIDQRCILRGALVGNNGSQGFRAEHGRN